LYIINWTGQEVVKRLLWLLILRLASDEEITNLLFEMGSAGRAMVGRYDRRAACPVVIPRGRPRP
jgi:hypothetical protein